MQSLNTQFSLSSKIVYLTCKIAGLTRSQWQRMEVTSLSFWFGLPSWPGCFVCMHTDNRAAMFHNAGAINNSGDRNCNTSNQHSLRSNKAIHGDSEENHSTPPSRKRASNTTLYTWWGNRGWVHQPSWSLQSKCYHPLLHLCHPPHRASRSCRPGVYRPRVAGSAFPILGLRHHLQRPKAVSGIKLSLILKI